MSRGRSHAGAPARDTGHDRDGIVAVAMSAPGSDIPIVATTPERYTAGPTRPSSRHVITLHLVRHGQASAGTDHYDRLSARGRHQAALLGRWWGRIGLRADAFVSGTLERQRDTATLARRAGGFDVPIESLPALDEYDHQAVDRQFGEGARCDGETPMDFAQYAAIMRRWRAAGDGAGAALESHPAFERRCGSVLEDALARAAGPEARLVMFTSGGVIATIVSSVLATDFDRTLEAIWQLRNASVTTLSFEDDRFLLIDYNTVGHLDAESDPSLLTLI